MSHTGFTRWADNRTLTPSLTEISTLSWGEASFTRDSADLAGDARSDGVRGAVDVAGGGVFVVAGGVFDAAGVFDAGGVFVAGGGVFFAGGGVFFAGGAQTVVHQPVRSQGDSVEFIWMEPGLQSIRERVCSTWQDGRNGNM